MIRGKISRAPAAAPSPGRTRRRRPRLLEGLCRPGLAVQSDFAVPLLRSVESSPLSPLFPQGALLHTCETPEKSVCAWRSREPKRGRRGGCEGWLGRGGGWGVNPLLAPFKSVRASADSSLANPLTCRGWRASSCRS